MIVKRKCISCGEIKNRNDLIKITRTADGVVVNPDSKTFGRSAYVCKNESCINGAVKKDRIFKVLKTQKDSSLSEKLRKLAGN